jgi:hypothetical protein
LKLVADGLPMILAAVTYRLYAVITGGQPIEIAGSNIGDAIQFCACRPGTREACPHGIKHQTPAHAVAEWNERLKDARAKDAR